MLGMTEAAIGVAGRVFYKGGGGTMLRVYERPTEQPAAQYTVVAFST
jgi:hypothetical protein